ncbi:MAG: OmpA family protein [Coleofasciculaceae cyanobacterium]
MTQSTNPDAKTDPKRSNNRPPWLLVLIFRLLLLGVGSGLALISGIVYANFYPNPQPKQPLLFKVLDRLSSKQPISPANASPPTSDNPQSQLTPEEKQQAQAQLNKLQEQLKQLSSEIAALEKQLGNNVSNQGLETRLQAIALQIQGIPNDATNSNGTQSTNASLVQSGKLKVTLPSDILFAQNDTLRPESNLLLDKIIADLRDYPASTVRITAHTDDTGETQANRELSFRRAQAVEQYLAEALGDKYNWLTEGDGATRPLVPNDSPTNQQRNRRVEIAVE